MTLSVNRHDKKQEEIDQQEWENPDNWSTIYFSKRDSRASVPKKNPKHGWTINFGHPKGLKRTEFFRYLPH